MFYIEKLSETDIGRRCNTCKSEKNLRKLKIKNAGTSNDCISIILCQDCLKKLSDRILEDSGI